MPKLKEIPYFAVGKDELVGAKELRKGDMVKCDRCGKMHTLTCAIDTKTGKETDILLFYKCGKNSYLAAVGNDSVMNLRR